IAVPDNPTMFAILYPPRLTTKLLQFTRIFFGMQEKNLEIFRPAIRAKGCYCFSTAEGAEVAEIWHLISATFAPSAVNKALSAFDDADRSELGDLSADAGLMHHVDHATDILISFRHLLRHGALAGGHDGHAAVGHLFVDVPAA